ncbi:Transcriptional regulator [uncultured Pleomorphomonas sp.]|nr:MarR family transcriptional regulator [uncultured Pleomorphomonas sp.]SCM76361.1 Transcriptional regulator [uncultured Pleomorphomonas sp.]
METLSGGESHELMQLIGGVNRRFELAVEARLKPLGFTIEQYRVLEALDRHDGQPMGELAQGVFVDSPTLTKIIDRMIANGDVYRAPDPGDRRRVLIFKSEKGVAQLVALRERLKDTLYDFSERIDRSAAGQLRGLLQSLLPPN